MAASSGLGTLLYPKLVSLCTRSREELCAGFSVACGSTGYKGSAGGLTLFIV